MLPVLRLLLVEGESRFPLIQRVRILAVAGALLLSLSRVASGELCTPDETL